MGLREVEGGSPLVAARAAHEANRQWQIACNDRYISPPWEQLDEPTRQSALIGVQRIRDNPAVTAESMHASWMDTKTAQGWRYGPERDNTNLLHPPMVPYDQLSDAEQFKDELFVAVVKGVLGIPVA